MRHACGIIVLLTIFATGISWSQEDLPRENVMAKGVVKGVRPGVLAIVTEQGEQWLVKVPDRPQDVSFVASANRSWLRPGMLVKFKNTFDAKGRPVALVRQLEVISLRTDTQLGLIPDSNLGGAATGLFSSDEPVKKQAAPETKSFTVTGTLRGYKDGNILVAAGSTSVQSQLDEKASISVDVSDYTLARDGDSVQLNGWYFLGQRDRVFSNRLTISSTQKLGMEEGADNKKGSAKKEPPKKDDVEKSLEDLFSK
ncbi:MAG: hypothetical protein HYV60_09275 [Planctomycetia bacterium]|nr:hypothetical protein [Planctomycetia bacterium]